jgi:hypothetical protein
MRRGSGGNHSAVDVSTRVAARHLGPMFRPGRPSGRVTAVGRACCEADRPFSIGARLVLMNVGSARRVLSHTRVINQLSCCLATLQHRRVYEGERQGECAALFRECFAHCVIYRPVQTNGGNMPSHVDGQRPLRLITIAGGGKRPGPGGLPHGNVVGVSVAMWYSESRQPPGQPGCLSAVIMPVIPC